MAPPTLTYFLRTRDRVFTFLTSPLKPLIVLISNCTKMLSDPFPTKVVQIRIKFFKMAAWRDFESRLLFIIGFYFKHMQNSPPSKPPNRIHLYYIYTGYRSMSFNIVVFVTLHIRVYEFFNFENGSLLKKIVLSSFLDGSTCTCSACHNSPSVQMAAPICATV